MQAPPMHVRPPVHAGEQPPGGGGGGGGGGVVGGTDGGPPGTGGGRGEGAMGGAGGVFPFFFFFFPFPLPFLPSASRFRPRRPWPRARRRAMPVSVAADCEASSPATMPKMLARREEEGIEVRMRTTRSKRAPSMWAPHTPGIQEGRAIAGDRLGRRPRTAHLYGMENVATMP